MRSVTLRRGAGSCERDIYSDTPLRPDHQSAVPLAIARRNPDFPVMECPSERRITAVLGPTNTGKTYLAVERMLGHRSGMIGFPLRLLARENYDRIVAAKGAARVALVTGEEQIVPPNPSWFVCTVESMPLDRSDEHTSELQSLMRISYAVLCLTIKKKIQ